MLFLLTPVGIEIAKISPITVIRSTQLLTGPSLFIDDRRYAYTEAIPQKAWKLILWSLNAPSSTAYIEVGGKRYSLKQAADGGLIYSRIYVKIKDSWYYFSNLTDVFFEAGCTYAIYSFVDGSTLNILVPGNKYRRERSLSDMIKIATQDGRFTSLKAETYQERLDWDPSWELRKASFDYLSPTRSGSVQLFHAILKSNPLVRYVGFNDPDTANWSGWIRMDWNKLE